MVNPDLCPYVDADAQEDVNRDLHHNISNQRILSVLGRRNITKLQLIQALAVQNGLFFRRGMLVFSPSGSGKTLIGELAAVNSVLEGYGKAAYLVPLKALATEKYKQFVHYWGPLGIRVEIAIGDYDMPVKDLLDADIIIMTYEKMDSILRSMFGKLRGMFGAIVIDEIHIIGEEGRGPRLASLIISMTQILGDVQFIGLSATVANPVEFNEWLVKLGHETTLLISKKRPVALDYNIQVSQNDVDAIVRILDENYAKGGMGLVFTRSRRKAESLANQLSGLVGKLPSRDNYNKRVQLAFKIKRNQKHSDLPPLIIKGVAFHHAGLSAIERDVVEYAFRNKIIHTIFCTTTLSAGINMPARVVILQNFKKYVLVREQVADESKFEQIKPGGRFFFKALPRNTFHQILGRAGRAGFDEEGLCYVLARNTDEVEWIKKQYFTSAWNADKEVLKPVYDPLASMLRDRDILMEQVLISMNEAGEVDLSFMKFFFQKTFFNFLLDDDTIPLDAVLQLKHVTAIDFVQYGRNLTQQYRAEHPESHVIIDQFDEHRISGSIFPDRFNRYECTLTRDGGLQCNCDWKGQVGMEGTCIHARLLVEAVMMAHPGEVGIINDIVSIALQQDSYFDYLLEHGFIEKRPSGMYACTTFGRLSTRLYIYPRIALLIKQRLLEIVVERQDPSFNPSMKPMDLELFNLVHRVLKELRSSVNNTLFASVWAWINEKPLEDVYEPRQPLDKCIEQFEGGSGNIYPGDFANFRKEMMRWMHAIRKIAQFLHVEFISEATEVLEKRIESGIKSELISIVSGIKGVGRIRGRILHNGGYHSLDEVQESNPSTMHGLT
ncbi:MAG: DEAD/DEAH box helicase, partial [Promethearchaeota archaeon]